MARIRPFRALRPRKELSDRIAALPYDVYSREEAAQKVKGDRLSFLNIDRPETQFPAKEDMYGEAVYRKAGSLLRAMEEEHLLIQDDAPSFYVYELTMGEKIQTGLVACAAVDDYLDGTIRRHENTRREKEEDRVRHIDACSAQTGPILLAHRQSPAVKELLERQKEQEPLCSFTAEDGVRHRAWQVEAGLEARLRELFEDIGPLYIADGHHRAASAVRVSLMRREKYPDFGGDEEFNGVLSVLFADAELTVMDYNRVLKNWNGHGAGETARLLEQAFVVGAPQAHAPVLGQKGEMGFYDGACWRLLRVREALRESDPVEGLDVSFLQRQVLEPLFGIRDPQTDRRIDFVGGIRGTGELERRCREDCACAFSLYPTSLAELFAVADAGRLMPPKSTWFEPKLRSGLFIHKIER